MSSILYNTHMRKVMYIVAINACAHDYPCLRQDETNVAPLECKVLYLSPYSKSGLTSP